ncbi:MAG: hypothetical protein JRG94_25480 [Deltaproteobacteria bacterium]|nr:hypothetical protein [Deltaproteobacteria bacterium]
MSDNGLHVVVAALILGVCMIGGAYMVSGSIDRVTGQIPEFESAMKSIQTAVAARGGDPNKVYTVASAGAPFKGPVDAKITVVEFADFQ